MQNGLFVGQAYSKEGRFQFPVAPGEYKLNAYGASLHKRYVTVTVPHGVATYDVPPIALVESRLKELEGHPAPELAGIVGWKGTPTRLAVLRGKYVLIDFWGYWCDPCVHAMPILMDLQEKFGDKGLAILTVHIDSDGDVDTAAKLDEVIADARKTIWGGRDLPFPTALSNGTEMADGSSGVTAAQYGIMGYPTTILIDRSGNIVGEFEEARALPAAEAKIASLLSAKP